VLFPLLLMVPTEEFPPAIPFTVHVTAVEGAPVAVTLAVKACPAPVDTVADGGTIPTTTSSFKVMGADAAASGCEMLVAVIVITAGDGRMLGAVYSPVVEIVPVPALPPATPFTAQVTLVLDVPVTVA